MNAQPSVSATDASLAQALAADMRRRWSAGERSLAEDYLARHPELADDPEAAIDLVYEEFCLRNSAGEADASENLSRRFPRWAGPLRVMFDCHCRLLEADRQQPDYPVAGERLGDFRLLCELSRGARGRVFLAHQCGLADRPVVLKVTPLDEGSEHLSLARLQHTHVVPLYMAVDDPVRRLRVLCMPYFGGATLASVLTWLADVPPGSRTGRHLLDGIDACEARECGHATASAQPAAAARDMLANVSYVQAVCWIGACLADALHFAHERGLLHLDLKPSNVLLARDGQPMLLDFHLAREPIRPGKPVAESFGGTPAYMPPEQQAAVRSLRDGVAVTDQVDARADVFALGTLLHEALGGAAPPLDHSPTPLCRCNPQVSVGLSDVIARCTAAASGVRYPTAAAVADDLRRHLTDQPLVGVANRSVRERWRKWRRRRPGTLRTATAALMFVAAAALLYAAGAAHLHDRRSQASLALSEGQRQLQSAGKAPDASQTFQRGLALLDGLPFQNDLRRRLQHELAAARRLDLAGQLRAIADDVRVLYVSDHIPPEHAGPLAAQCESLWRRRDEIRGALPAAGVGDDLRDVAIFAARVRGQTPSRAAAARALLDEAESDFGPSPVLDHERAALGTPVTPILPARTAWEHVALGRAHLTAGDLPAASRELSAALAMEPAARWGNFYYGMCAYRARRYEDAAAAFSLCIGAAPEASDAFYNRALAYAALGQTQSAARDCDRVLQLDAAHVNARALRERLRVAADSASANRSKR